MNDICYVLDLNYNSIILRYRNTISRYLSTYGTRNAKQCCSGASGCEENLRKHKTVTYWTIAIFGFGGLEHVKSIFSPNRKFYSFESEHLVFYAQFKVSKHFTDILCILSSLLCLSNIITAFCIVLIMKRLACAVPKLINPILTKKKKNSKKMGERSWSKI